MSNYYITTFIPDVVPICDWFCTEDPSIPPLPSQQIEVYSSVDRALSSQPILIVDDDAGMRTMLETVLIVEGYQVKLARNGREALRLISQERPALVLLDLMMPVMNGWEFLQEIQKLSQFSNLPIVLLSASRDLVRAARQSSIKAYLPKPFELDKLLLYIEQYRESL